MNQSYTQFDDLIVVRNERLALQKELADLKSEMAGYLEELGYGA